MITATWLSSIWNSQDKLSSIITLLNWGIVMTLVCGGVLTAFVILAGNRRDLLLRAVEAEKDHRIAEANKVAAEANQRAAEANFSALSASQKVAEANARMEEARAGAAKAVEGQTKLEADAEQARLQQEQIRKQNLELQSQVERERTARIKLETQVGFRTISPEHEAALIRELRRVVPNTRVVIRAPNSSSESSQFAERIRGVFVNSGWSTEPVFYNIVAGVPTERGVVLVVQSAKSSLGVLVQQAFAGVGIELKGAVDPQAPQDTVFLIVGQKP